MLFEQNSSLLKSASDLKNISPDLKVRETELLKARYQNIMSKKTEQNTLIKQCSEPESFRHKIQSNDLTGLCFKLIRYFSFFRNPSSLIVRLFLCLGLTEMHRDDDSLSNEK
jgi:hypothetical protein